MSQAIEQGAGETFAAEHLGPLVEGQIGRDHDAATLIAFGKELEEQFRSGLGEGDIAELVDDDQSLARQLYFESAQGLVVPGLQQRRDQPGPR